MSIVNVVPFETKHWDQIEEQPGVFKFNPPPLVLSYYAAQPWAITVLDAKGRVLMCGGIVKHAPHMGEAWCKLAALCRAEFVALFRVMKWLLDSCDLRRIQATVEVDFEQGHRMMYLLGFKLEAEEMRAYLADGRSCSMYSKVRGVDFNG